MNILGAVRFLLWVMVGNKNFRLQVLQQIYNKLLRLKLYVALVPKLFSKIKMWLRCSPSVHRALLPSPAAHELSLGVLVRHLSPWEVKVEGPEIQGHLGCISSLRSAWDM